ncbi:hypothetical protein CEXT_743571 [Caerostris extrusa]|uniref:Uncharacterized protein n=1 Tax=Caerostris extrusa TaxID=172846 RepID=A0AAV4MCE2_CAEEX|nr:hypothetical protein CEXT_743571 [Caerostris extrusa]
MPYSQLINGRDALKSLVKLTISCPNCDIDHRAHSHRDDKTIDLRSLSIIRQFKNPIHPTSPNQGGVTHHDVINMISDFMDQS